MIHCWNRPLYRPSPPPPEPPEAARTGTDLSDEAIRKILEAAYT